MNLEKLAEVLSDAVQAGPNVYVRSEPEILDFTDSEAKCDLLICASGGNIITVAVTPENLYGVISLFKVTIFKEGMKIIGWNWQSLMAYIRGRTGKPYNVASGVIDLKVIELYAGVREKAPEGLAGALNRLKSLVVDGTWKEIQPIYQKVHLPLLTAVIPSLETVGLLDIEAKKKVYAYYEICGQENGRLNCSGAYKDGFVPHTLSDTEKKRLAPRGLDEIFMYFDFKNMEVAMLQWLSKDEKLGEAIAQEDTYSTLYEWITGVSGDINCRNKAKKMFLPIIYGQSSQALSKRLKIAVPTAEKIITRIYNLFPVAFRWVESYQQQAKEKGVAKDVFGKRRFFDKGEEYLARNFSIQSPAATVCLEKLVQLHDALQGNVAFHVHDGYCVFAGKDNWKSIFQKGYAVLTSESSLCPGLRLKVACQAGRHLDGLKPLQKAKGKE